VVPLADGPLPPAAAAEANAASLPALPSFPVTPPLTPIAISSAPPTLWWGTLNVARGGTDLVTVTITPQPDPGTGLPGLLAGPQWAVFGTWTRVCSSQQNLVAGTIGNDGRTVLTFWRPGVTPSDQQLAIGTAGVGFDGRLYGAVQVVQGPDLNDTFSFVLDHP
jgi:hypothetical protein